MRLLVVLRLLAAGAPDHDLVLLDRDLHRPMAGPVLGVHRVILDGWVEPQTVALVAVVERRLERTGRRLATPGGATASAASSSAAISASSCARRSISSSKSAATAPSVSSSGARP